MDRPATANPATARDIILEIVRNMREGLEPLHYSTLPPAIFHVYLHPDDMERLRGILPRIVDEARRALDAELETLNRASLGERLKLARRAEPKDRRRRKAAGRSAFWRTPTKTWQPGDIAISFGTGAAGQGRTRRGLDDQADRHAPDGRRGVRPNRATMPRLPERRGRRRCQRARSPSSSTRTARATRPTA